MQCPKCKTEVRDVATFCTKCHNTLRFKCPSCQNEQRHGGTCDKCGIDFLKFAAVLMNQNRAELDVEHERIERRSGLLKHILFVPITGGITLLRHLLVSNDKK
jgi:hypothetical protein